MVHKLFNNKYPYYFENYHYKTSKYISRQYNHNYKRLILRRKKFINKFNKWNKEFNKVFRFRQLLTTLTDPGEIANDTV